MERFSVVISLAWLCAFSLALTACGRAPDTTIYYKDVLDAGDDPFTPGCEEVFTSPTCPAPGRTARGDYCVDVTHLFEGTDQNCHAGDVGKTYDCNAECIARGHAGGTCGPIPAMCAGLGSASCVCIDVVDKVVWASDRDGSYDIFIMDADGTNIEQLTHDALPDVNHHPVLTPDRSEVVWARDRELWIMSRDGSNPRRIGHTGLADHPWAGRDGRVYFTRFTAGVHTIWSVNLDGTDEKRLTEPVRESFHASLHPTEAEVIYTASRPGNTEGEEIRILNLDTGDDRVLYKPGWSVSAATWKYPDGDRFIVAEKIGTKYAISSVTYTAGDVAVLIQNDNDNIVPYYFSEGDSFVFTTVAGPRRTRELMKADADGSNPVNLTSHPAEDLVIAGYPDTTEPATGPCVRPPVGCNPVPPPCVLDIPVDVREAADLVGDTARARDIGAGVRREIDADQFEEFAMSELHGFLETGNAAIKAAANIVLDYLGKAGSPELRNGAVDILINSYLAD